MSPNFIQNLQMSLLQIYGNFMYLKIFVDSNDDDLKKTYVRAANNHHTKLVNNINNFDAGFDLFSPETIHLNDSKVNKLDYHIKCSAKIHKNDISYNTGYYMYPRSSISKSNVRLANNVGIIDSGYRGNLMGMFDVVYPTNVNVINKFERHLQICAPGLIPIIVELVDRIEDLGEETSRGNGGFGSTGI
jgi:dUTP pyrophosphatase